MQENPDFRTALVLSTLSAGGALPITYVDGQDLEAELLVYIACL